LTLLKLAHHCWTARPTFRHRTGKALGVCLAPNDQAKESLAGGMKIKNGISSSQSIGDDFPNGVKNVAASML